MQQFPPPSVIITQQPQQPYLIRTSRLPISNHPYNQTSRPRIQTRTRTQSKSQSATSSEPPSLAAIIAIPPTTNSAKASPLNNQRGHQCSEETQPPAVVTQIVRQERCFLCTAPNTVPAGYRFGNIIRPWEINQVN
ncbi:hypothetical protein GJ744_006917 [Endocarpon pusillum]|uniref:Uncharacterized protein n=1 Tax=Endocarpon pusillum TaxID=364733 RepID=A0A8H7E7Y3_9EURO|nr:hypothetical protein GJ744_006917 [Endocarpon pusillum]